jgi:hypothetical protein
MTKVGNSKKNRKPLWINPRALRKVKRKREAFKRYMRMKEGEDYAVYPNAKRESRKVTRQTVCD